MYTFLWRCRISSIRSWINLTFPCRLRSFRLRLVPFISRCTNISISSVTILTFFPSYDHIILLFTSGPWISRGFWMILNFWRRHFFGRVNKVLILFVMRERPKWFSRRPRSRRTSFTILSATVLRPEFSIVASLPSKFFFRGKQPTISWSGIGHFVTLRMNLWWSFIFFWGFTPVSCYVISVICFSFLLLVFDDFVEL